MKIAHIADIHYRGMSRHSEYRNIFQAFVDDVKRNNVDHIFVGGDIFHTKTTGLSPEYIEELSWWLNTLAEAAELHVTLGNHDGNLVNLSRQDAITPIVKALNNNRVHLYKKSGVYQFAPGYNWCIFSLFDESGWANVKPAPGDVNIACYHGSVYGATTETGWELTDAIPVEFFSEYDFAFLGDIHRTQYLGFRDVEIIIDESELKNYPTAEVLEELSNDI